MPAAAAARLEGVSRRAASQAAERRLKLRRHITNDSVLSCQCKCVSMR